MRYVQIAVLLGLSGCAKAVPTCGLCTGMGGAWLPETGTCADTCEEQAGDVLCVESVCPVDAPDGPATATTCEECILVGGGWDGVGCSEECEGDDCATTQCPDGSG